MAPSLELACIQLVQRASKDSWYLLWAWTRFTRDCHCLQETHTAETVLWAGPSASVSWKSRRDAEGTRKASWRYKQGEICIQDTISKYISSVDLWWLNQLCCPMWHCKHNCPMFIEENGTSILVPARCGAQKGHICLLQHSDLTKNP